MAYGIAFNIFNCNSAFILGKLIFMLSSPAFKADFAPFFNALSKKSAALSAFGLISELSYDFDCVSPLVFGN